MAKTPSTLAGRTQSPELANPTSNAATQVVMAPKNGIMVSTVAINPMMKA